MASLIPLLARRPRWQLPWLSRHRSVPLSLALAPALKIKFCTNSLVSRSTAAAPISAPFQNSESSRERSLSPPRPRTCRRACLVPPCGHPDRRTCWRYGADLRRRHLPTGNGDASPQCMVIGTRMGERPYLSALGCVSRSRRLIAASITGRGRSISSVWGCTGFVAYHPSLPEPHSPVPKERIPRGPTGTSPPPWSHGSDQTRQSLFLACFPRSRSGPLPHIHGRSFFVSVGYKKGRRGPARMMR